MHCVATVGTLKRRDGSLGPTVVACELSHQEAMGYGDPTEVIVCFEETGDRGEIVMHEIHYDFLLDIWEEDSLFRLFRAFGLWGRAYGAVR